MSDDFELDYRHLTRRMDGAIANLRSEFASLADGPRPRPSMLYPVQVEAYGAR